MSSVLETYILVFVLELHSSTLRMYGIITHATIVELLVRWIQCQPYEHIFALVPISNFISLYLYLQNMSSAGTRWHAVRLVHVHAQKGVGWTTALWVARCITDQHISKHYHHQILHKKFHGYIIRTI